MSEILFTLKDIAFRYPSDKNNVISDISLTVSKGELIGVIGPNGAGKSTFLKTASGIQKKSSGEITISGRKIEEYSRKEMAVKLSFLAQDVHEWYDISVEEITLLGRAPYLQGMGFAGEKDIALCHESMRLCGIFEHRCRSIHELSGGEKQKARLASIIAQETDLLMLDEPTAFLDIHNELEIFGLLSKLALDGKSVILATHNLNLAALFCHRLVLLEKGKMVDCGTPSEVITYDNIQKVYGKGFSVVTHPDSGKPVIYPNIFPEGIK